MTFGTVVVVAGALAAIAIQLRVRYLRQAHQADVTETAKLYDLKLRDWQQRRDEFEEREKAEIQKLDVWGAVPPPARTHRLDLFGGTPDGLRGLLTVLGASTVMERSPLVILNLGQPLLVRTLVGLTERVVGSAAVDVHQLTPNASPLDILSGLSPPELIDRLVDFIAAGDAEPGNRRVDRALLSRICERLNPHVSLPRILAALDVFRQPDRDGVLFLSERTAIIGGLFADAERDAALVRLDQIRASLLHLVPYATGQPLLTLKALQCLNLRADDGTLARPEVIWALTDWLTRQVRNGSPRPAGIIIVEADHVNPQQIEQLSDLCHSHGVRLTNLFRHLRDGATRSLGGGAAGFLRLQPVAEASEAAEYVGREHSFKVTSFTQTLGGGNSFGRAQREWNKPWTDAFQDSVQASWNNIQGSQRAYEYVVEPSIFQSLPEFVLLLVEHRPAGVEVQAVEFSPDILTLPRVSTSPLPDNPRASVRPAPKRASTTGPMSNLGHELPPRPEAGPALPRVPEVLETPSGQLLRYVVGDTDFVLVDSTTEGHVVSWSGTCDADRFIQLCRRLCETEADVEGMLVLDGQRIAGPGTEVLAAIDRLDGQALADVCDFIRFDLPDIDVAFHRMPTGDGAPPSIVISAVSAGPYGPDLADVVRETATPAVAQAVLEVAPSGNTFSTDPHPSAHGGDH